MTRAVLALVTVLLTAFIAVASVLDIARHGLSWLDVVALFVVVLFAVGIGGALWESIRRG